MNSFENEIFNSWGFLPGINEEFVLHPAYGDNGPALKVITFRQFNIDEQNYSEFWKNLEPEFWPDEY